MLAKFLIIGFASVNAFFNPSVRLSSGKTASIIGQGPPILFSTGLFGTMPNHMYGNIMNELKKNMTIISIDGIQPIGPKDITEVTDSLKVDSIAYMSHSSFNPTILETKRINSAVLLDPICIPDVNLNGVQQHSVNVDFPVLIIRAEKLYDTDNPLPNWQEINIKGNNVEDEIYDGVGHPDILDDIWGNIAQKIGLWGTAQGKKMSFKEWKFDNKNTVPLIRKDFRKYVSERALGFINKHLSI